MEQEANVDWSDSEESEYSSEDIGYSSDESGFESEDDFVCEEKPTPSEAKVLQYISIFFMFCFGEASPGSRSFLFRSSVQRGPRKQPFSKNEPIFDKSAPILF